jgi:hypothetical protein
MDMELVFYRTLQEAGLPAPRMRVEVPVGDDPSIVRWTHDLFVTLLPRMRRDELAASGIGDLDTLESRLEASATVSARSGSSEGSALAASDIWSLLEAKPTRSRYSRYSGLRKASVAVDRAPR